MKLNLRKFCQLLIGSIGLTWIWLQAMEESLQWITNTVGIDTLFGSLLWAIPVYGGGILTVMFGLWVFVFGDD